MVVRSEAARTGDQYRQEVTFPMVDAPFDEPAAGGGILDAK
jgi:hypothetical protein